MRQFRSVAKSLVKEELQSDAIDDICDFVLNTLAPVCQDSDTDLALKRLAFADLRRKFSVANDAALEEALRCCHTLCMLLPVQTTPAPSEFGKDIPFSFAPEPEAALPVSFHTAPSAPALPDSFAALRLDSSGPPLSQPSAQAAPSNHFVDSSWLKSRCEQVFSAAEAAGMALAIFECLRGSHSSDQLQGELFDLLGDRCAYMHTLSLFLSSIYFGLVLSICFPLSLFPFVHLFSAGSSYLFPCRLPPAHAGRICSHTDSSLFPSCWSVAVPLWLLPARA